MGAELLLGVGASVATKINVTVGCSCLDDAECVVVGQAERTALQIADDAR